MALHAERTTVLLNDNRLELAPYIERAENIVADRAVKEMKQALPLFRTI